ARVEGPVEILQIVAGHVLAMIGELNREAMEGTLVQAVEKPFDNDAGQERREADSGQDGRIEIALRVDPLQALREPRPFAGHDRAVQLLKERPRLGAEAL